MVLAPLNEQLPPQERMATVIGLSELMMRIATYVICYALVECQELLKEERLSIAHALMQRVMTTHLCNHKLTKEGLVYEYKGEPFELHEEYKTMTLTRSVYEHLVMYYFLFEHPKNGEECHLVWKYWQSTGKSGEVVEEDGKREVRRVAYSQAWRYLFDNDEMASFYRNLSMHCHPVYQGLMQYQEQGQSDEGNDGLPLYFSCRFLARLCWLFLRQIPNGRNIIRKEFSQREQTLFYELFRL